MLFRVNNYLVVEGYHVNIVKRRFLQTQPALGPARKIMRDRSCTILTGLIQAEETQLKEYNLFRAWLKAVYPHAKNLKPLPTVSACPKDKEITKTFPYFSRTLRHITEYLLNQNLPPPAQLVSKLLKLSKNEHLLMLSLKVLQATRFLGQPPDDNQSSEFITAAMSVYCTRNTKSESVEKFVDLIRKAIGQEFNGSVFIGPKALAALFESAEVAIATVNTTTSLPLKDRQQKIFQIFQLIGTISQAAELNAFREHPNHFKYSILKLLCAADHYGVPNYIKENTPEYLIPGEKQQDEYPFSKWISNRLWSMAEEEVRKGFSLSLSQVHGALCESYLKRKTPLPEWVVMVPSHSKSKRPVYIQAYCALDELISDGNLGKFSTKLAELSIQIESLSSHWRPRAEQALKFVQHQASRAAAVVD